MTNLSNMTAPQVLAPCPFCAGESCTTEGSVGRGQVNCPDCGAFGPHPSMDMVHGEPKSVTWNCRPEAHRLQADNDRLRGDLRRSQSDASSMREDLGYLAEHPVSEVMEANCPPCVWIAHVTYRHIRQVAVAARNRAALTDTKG